jgi:hypothetical protein
VVLEAQVPVQGAGVVLLDDEPVAASRGGLLVRDRLRGPVPVTLAAVLVERHMNEPNQAARVKRVLSAGDAEWQHRLT